MALFAGVAGLTSVPVHRATESGCVLRTDLQRGSELYAVEDVKGSIDMKQLEL